MPSESVNTELILYRLDEMARSINNLKDKVSEVWTAIDDLRDEVKVIDKSVAVNRAKNTALSGTAGGVLGALAGILASLSNINA